MSVLVFAAVKVNDPEKFEQYASAAGPTLAAFGAELLLRGTYNASLTDVPAHSLGAVIKFPSKQAVDDWYASPAYQAIIPVRDAAADVSLTVYDAIP